MADPGAGGFEAILIVSVSSNRVAPEDVVADLELSAEGGRDILHLSHDGQRLLAMESQAV